jgi:hypothetical protein
VKWASSDQLPASSHWLSAFSVQRSAIFQRLCNFSLSSVALCLLLILMTACAPGAAPSALPTPISFPTMTPGARIEGVLPAQVGLPLDGVGLANPATAVALANQPTPTPNYAACPVPANPPLEEAAPTNGLALRTAIINYLTQGGAPLALADQLRLWGVIGEQGAVEVNTDFTGAGQADVILSYAAPDEGGTLLIAGCANGTYTIRYQTSTGGAAPQIISSGDLNADNRPDLLFSAEVCAADNPDDCAFRTQLMTFDRESGRFVSLLNGTLSSASPPTTSDIDDDRVQEIVVRSDFDGNRATGPLRTGTYIYDWNGSNFTLSIVQLDPPRFKIQVLQEADRAFTRQEFDSAIALYSQAETDTALGFWYNDEQGLLSSYAFYRLVLAYAYTEDDRLLPTYQAAVQPYPDPAAAPVYITLLNTFWNALQVTGNLNSACREVQAIIGTRPEALALLNRYGSRSPTYTAADLCPF